MATKSLIVMITWNDVKFICRRIALSRNRQFSLSGCRSLSALIKMTAAPASNQWPMVDHTSWSALYYRPRLDFIAHALSLSRAKAEPMSEDEKPHDAVKDAPPANDAAEKRLTPMARPTSEGQRARRSGRGLDTAPTAEERLADVNDQLLRSLAELENTRKRAARDRSEALKFGAMSFARDMLGVVDNLQRALSDAGIGR